MRKYIVLFCTLFYIGLYIYQLYYAYTPKVNEIVIWTNFIISMIGCIAFTTITIRMFMKDNKKRINKKNK